MSGPKLARFVKVMTGGKVVTDSVAEARLAKVNARIAAARADLGRLATKGLTDDAVLAKVQRVEAGRDAANSGSAAERYRKLEPVKAAAATAAGEVTTAVNAVLQAAADRDADVEALEELVQDIVDGQADIAADAVEAQRFRGVETPFNQQIARLDAAKTAATIATERAGVAALKTRIATAQAGIDRAKADLASSAIAERTAKSELDIAMLWADWLDGQGQPNAFRTEVSALQAVHAGTDATPAAGRAAAYQGVETRARAISVAGAQAQTRINTISSTRQSVEATLRYLPTPSPVLNTKAAGLPGKIADAVKRATLTNLDTGLAAVETEANTLRADTDKAEIAACNVVGQQRAAEDCLTAARAAVDALTPPDAALEAELAALESQQVAGNAERDAGRAKAIFLPLARKAAALLTKAKKIEFGAKAATAQGRGELDTLVAQFGPTTRNARDRAICEAALGARFDMEVLVQPGMPANRLPMLYDLFRKLPAGHMPNEQLGRLEYGTKLKSAGNYHTPVEPGSAVKGVIAFNDMPETDDPYSYDSDDGGTATATYFNATSLHEVGHGVDAKFRVMQTNKGSAGFGKWRNETLDSAATAYGNRLATAFAGTGKAPTATDLVALAKSYLSGSACAKPANAAAPLGSLLADWDAIVAHDVVRVCRAARSAASPWDGGGGFATSAKGTDNRVVFEAYPGDWYSYDFAERTATGISTYQWRSPMEWFAEIYALYHTTGRQPPASVRQWVAPPAP